METKQLLDENDKTLDLFMDKYGDKLTVITVIASLIAMIISY